MSTTRTAPSTTIDELLAATIPHQAQSEDDDIGGKIADSDCRLAQYRATLDADAKPVAGWITETEAERA